MRLLRRTIALMVLTICTSPAQDISDKELARRLADPNKRAQAVAAIRAAGENKIPVLLSWAAKPPTDVRAYELKIGLADAFGALKAREAIPFLVKNIDLDRAGEIAQTFTRAPEIIEGRLAAAMALVEIGPDAIPAVVRTATDPTRYYDRLAAIFTMSMMKNDPRARGYVTGAIRGASFELRFAEDALARMGPGDDDKR